MNIMALFVKPLTENKGIYFFEFIDRKTLVIPEPANPVRCFYACREGCLETGP